jgi:hypothetical protein
MSDRTALRFALASLVAAALASPVVAQVSNPWQGTAPAVAPMPRGKSAELRLEFGIEVGRGPVLFERRLDFRLPAPPPQAFPHPIVLNEGNFTGQCPITGPGCLIVSPPSSVQVIGVGRCSSGDGVIGSVVCAQESCCTTAGKLSGTWYRDLEALP